VFEFFINFSFLLGQRSRQLVEFRRQKRKTRAYIIWTVCTWDEEKGAYHETMYSNIHQHRAFKHWNRSWYFSKVKLFLTLCSWINRKWLFYKYISSLHNRIIAFEKNKKMLPHIMFRCTNPPPVDATWPLSIIVRSDVTIQQNIFLEKVSGKSPESFPEGLPIWVKVVLVQIMVKNLGSIWLSFIIFFIPLEIFSFEFISGW